MGTDLYNNASEANVGINFQPLVCGREAGQGLGDAALGGSKKDTKGGNLAFFSEDYFELKKVV